MVKNYKSGTYKQQFEYKSFVPSLINCELIITNPKIHVALGEANR
jgi:hypothetical protein